jgi:hypothetical protein
MRPPSVQRGGARAFGMARVLLASAALVGACVLAGGCMETQRALGEACLKNDDCLSGICSSLTCAAAPPLVGTEAVADAAGAADTSTEPPEDASESKDTASDQGPSAEEPDADDAAESSAADDGGSVD